MHVDVTSTGEAPNGKRLTPRGAATRARIVDTASDLIRRNGVGATRLDQVIAAAGVSKSQFYHHFDGKDPLVRAVIDLNGERVIRRERTTLGEVSTFEGLRGWADGLIKANALQHGAYGCALGSLASDVADHDEEARAALARLFEEWARLIEAALIRIRDAGELPPDANVSQLASGVLGALQGGYLLAQTARDVRPMADSLDLALRSLASSATA
jgi:AcrR family transcriptional regulator